MIVNKQKLLQVLQGMQSNAGKLDFSISNQINFKDNIIYQVNNDIMIYNEFFNEKLDDFSLRLSDLNSLLTKIKKDEIELNIDELVKIKTGKTEIELSKAENKLDYNFNNTFEWIELPDNFIEGITFANKILIADDRRFNPVIFIDNNKIISTDGKCLIIYNLGLDFLKFFLKKEQINLLLKFDITKYCIKDNLIYFLALDNTIIYFNYLTDCKFPEYERIQLQNEKEIHFLDKLNIADIDINISILDNESKMLKIEIEEKAIIIKTNNSNINIKTKVEKENKDLIKFNLDYNYLLEFLKSEYSKEFKTFITENMICFKNEDITFITMLMEN